VTLCTVWSGSEGTDEAPIHRENNPVALTAGAGAGIVAAVPTDDPDDSDVRDCMEGLLCNDAGNEGDTGSRFGDKYPVVESGSKLGVEGNPLGKTVL
jgi:hypothetical protein